MKLSTPHLPTEAATAALFSAATSPARAPDPAVVVSAVCPTTEPRVAACIGAGTFAHDHGRLATGTYALEPSDKNMNALLAIGSAFSNGTDRKPRAELIRLQRLAN